MLATLTRALGGVRVLASIASLGIKTVQVCLQCSHGFFRI
jgi:hypothetical protein